MLQRLVTVLLTKPFVQKSIVMRRRVAISVLALLPFVLGCTHYWALEASAMNGVREFAGHADPLSSVAQPDPCATPSICTVTISCPALINPQNPLRHGAYGDGMHDDTAAVQASINAGDVCFPAGKVFLINSPPLTIIASNKHFQCEPGAVIRNLNHTSGKYILHIKGPTSGGFSSITGDSVIGCDWEGSNTEPPGYSPRSQWNIPILLSGVVSGALIAGNTFNRWWGQAEVEFYGGGRCGGKGNVVEHNTFRNCGLYGPVIDASLDNTFAHNTLIDCSEGVENDTATQCSGGNVLRDETLTCVFGQGEKSMRLCALLTGGSAAGGNYSGNTVENNSVSGASREGLPSALYKSATGGAPFEARYINNRCTAGCKVR